MKNLLIGTVCLALAGFAALAQDVDRGIELYNQKKYDQAEQTLRAAVREEPKNSRALYYLGLSLLEQKKPGEAIDPLRKAASASPDQADINTALARAYIDEKDYDQASSALDAAAKADADNKHLPYLRGVVALLGKKDYRAAADQLDEAIKREPDNAYAEYYAGMAYSRLGQPDRMVAHFERFLKMAPKAPEAQKVRSFLSATR